MAQRQIGASSVRNASDSEHFGRQQWADSVEKHFKQGVRGAYEFFNRIGPLLPVNFGKQVTAEAAIGASPPMI